MNQSAHRNLMGLTTGLIAAGLATGLMTNSVLMDPGVTYSVDRARYDPNAEPMASGRPRTRKHRIGGGRRQRANTEYAIVKWRP